MIPINPTFKLVIGLVLIAAVGALKALGVVEPAWQWIGTVVQVLTAAEFFFTVPTNAEKKLGQAAKAFLPVVFVVGLGETQSACLSSAPIVPVTPANQAQIDTCENTASFHNDAVLGDFVFTGGAATFGAVSALEANTGTKNAMAISGAVSGGLAVLASSVVALSANNFANNQCSSVVGNLPAAGSK